MPGSKQTPCLDKLYIVYINANIAIVPVVLYALRTKSPVCEHCARGRGARMGCHKTAETHRQQCHNLGDETHNVSEGYGINQKIAPMKMFKLD